METFDLETNESLSGREANTKMSQQALETALAVIGEVRSDIGTLGANDSEPSELDKVEQLLKSGSISTNIAIDRANAIRSKKMDYR